MPGTWFGLEIAKRGTMVHRKALDVTGHNIANASTPGYSRQEAVITPTTPWARPDLSTKMLPGQLGTGSDVTEVRRIRDYYLDVQSRHSGSYEGYWEKKLDMAKRMETVFLEPDGRGLQATLLNFFNDWQDLNNNPQDPGVKKAVKESGDELAAIFRQMHSQLATINESINGSLQYEVDQVNQLVTKIADLSNTIIHVIRNGAQPNDLLDERDNLLDQLAKYGHINVTTQDNGMIEVRFIESAAILLKNDGYDKVVASKVNLVTGAGALGNENHLSVDGMDVINLTALADYYSKAPEGAGKGSILGQESARLENEAVSLKLDRLAASIIENINRAAGVPRPGDVYPPPAFFQGTSAADITLNEVIKADPEKIIGENALAVARLRSTPINTLDGQISLRQGITFTNNDQMKFTVTLPDGTSKDIDLGLDSGLTVSTLYSPEEIKAAIQNALDKKFGKDEIRVGLNEDARLSFSLKKGDGKFEIASKKGNDVLFGGNAIKDDPDITVISTTVLNTTFEKYFQGIVAQVGAAVDHHDKMLENQQAIGQQVEALRQSVSGVSVDEELTKVIQFQYGYQACARMIALQDEMLDYLINRIR
ncbi:flagellar hook protein FlgK [Desulforamulus profundi]|uniref:Flagellar hook-associated protein 1 n=1 Tax=Desulforamulus profundi TaxID=1383067 RepID=A0A2C6L1S6_9FIRM|nr:flagellar hook-associated protein FlgK [Desulforamulus profundi]PHJ37301.1 flagellar hook protein FlgK [Desulforamulus profundi]